MVIGTKIDLTTRRNIQKQEALNWIKSKGIQLYFEVSSLSNLDVDTPFYYVASIIQKKSTTIS